MSTIKNRLKALRNEKGLTQDELVSELNSKLGDSKKAISKMTISNWENNKHSIKQDKAELLANFFGVSVPYLLGYSEKIPVEEQSSLYKNGVTDIEAVDPIYLVTESIGIENKDRLLNFLKNEFNLEYNEFKADIEEPYEDFINRTTNSSIHNLWELPKSLSDLIAYWSMLSDNQRTNLLSIIKDLSEVNNP